MAKRRKQAGGGGGRPPRVHHPVLRRSPNDEPDPLDDVRDLLRDDDALGVVALASVLVSTVEPGPSLPFDDDEDLSPADLAHSLIAMRVPETTALLAGFAHLVTDQVLLQRIRQELDRRGGAVPGGIDRLGPLSAERAVATTHVLGDAEMLLVEARTADGRPLTVVLTVNHEYGTVVTDGFGYPGTAANAVGAVDADDPDVAVADLDLADARARIHEAVETGRITYPPFESATWPGCRPLLEWVLRALPEGGTGYVRPEIGEDEQRDIAERFHASSHGREHDHPDGRDLLDTLLWYGCDYGTGDPLTWSPTAVEILLTDWLPRKVVADPAYLDLAPDLLRSFIRFGHEERGLRQELTAATLEVVDVLEADYRRAIRTDRPQGPAALLAAMGWDDDGEQQHGAAAGRFEGHPHAAAMAQHHLTMLDLLTQAVGDADALRALTDEPLPDEPFDWDVVPADVHDQVGATVALLDRCADELFDVEFRTAARRLLADVVAADPGIFRRRGHAETAAAAIAWILGKANDLFDSYGDGLSIGDLSRWFGISGGPSQRAATLLAALGIDTDGYRGMYLGTSRYLTSTRRAQIVQRRDDAVEGLAGFPIDADEELVDDSWADDLDGDPSGDDPWDEEPSRDDDPWGNLERFDLLPTFDFGIDPAPPAPWRTAEPVDVLAVGWFPSEDFAAAVDRWPDLAARVGTRDYASYARVVQGTLLDVSREHGNHPVLVPLDPDEVEELAEGDESLDAADWRARAALAGALAASGDVRPWPPGRNDPCWCGSGRKYKKCCDTVPPDPRRREAHTAGAAQAYELEVTLAGVSPRIWRRIAIAADGTFADLHDAIQDACGWQHAHLFAFSTLDGQPIGGSPDPGGLGGPFGEPDPDARTVPLPSYFETHDRCRYEYDFGDGWGHEITVVGRIEDPVDYRRRLLDGARAFPPEDCGGLPGYDDCVDVATGGEDVHDLVGRLGDWDPERFDLAATQRRFDR